MQLHTCPDSATCRATPDARGRCPYHAEHMAARDEYDEAEADALHLWRTR